MEGEYRRIKEVSFLLLETKKEGKKERLILCENNLVVIIALMVILEESMKNLYLGYKRFSLRERLLLGDIIISEQDGKEDQRLFCLQLSINYLTAFLYLSTYLFDKQKVHQKRFSQLSKFLLVLDSDEYARTFLVPKKFAVQFSKHLDR